MERGDLPNLLLADEKGIILEHPYLKMVGFDGRESVPIPREGLVRLPPFSKLFYLPGVRPVGLDRERGTLEVVEELYVEGRGKIRPCAVAAFLSPGYVRTHLPAGRPEAHRPLLPLWAYTAAGAYGNRIYGAAFLVEKNPKWDPRNYDDRDILPRVKELKRRFPQNRLLRHLSECALSNHCFAAKNLFLGRWEAPVPTSRVCNAKCLGCLSDQEDERIKSHDRIRFRPSVGEIVALFGPHLAYAPEPIVSFGQGCEGEPLTEYLLIGEAIEALRSTTERGVINLNTNGSWPERIKSLCEAGLDSLRVSLSSAREPFFNAYHRPLNYTLKDVVEGLKVAKALGVFTMINYLVFPGVTDERDEFEALSLLIEETQVDFIHLKNLCIDPWIYLGALPSGPSSPMGLKRFLEALKERFPNVNFGYFNQVPKGMAQ
ncbi:MAG: radical SAM protein [Desulfatiglandales bacterium]